MGEFDQISDHELRERYNLLEREWAEVKEDLYLLESEMVSIQVEMYKRSCRNKQADS